MSTSDLHYPSYATPGTDHGLAPNGQRMVGKSKCVNIVLQQEVLSLVLAKFSLREIAFHLRVSYTKIRQVARDPEFLVMVRDKSEEIGKLVADELSTSQIEFAKRLEEASEEALDEMVAMMRNIDGPTKLKREICQDLMDRDVRASRRTTAKVETTHDFINPAVLIHAAASAKELTEFKEKRLGGDNPGHNADSSER